MGILEATNRQLDFIFGAVTPKKEEPPKAASNLTTNIIPPWAFNGKSIREEICLCRITCPKCGGSQYIRNWEPGRCVHCGESLADRAGELKPEDVCVELAISQLTGQVVVL